MKFIEKVWLWKFYFNRGHAQYVMMPITMFNFAVIQYELFIKQYEIFNNIFEFMLILFVIYLPVASLLGRYDFKHKTGAVMVEQKLIKEVSPIYQEIFKNQQAIINRLDQIEEK